MIIKRNIIFNRNNGLVYNKKLIGNPASVIILEKNENLKNNELLKNIAIKENQPISCFVKQKETNHEFDIRFFTPSGDEVNICGHGSLITGKILKEHFNIKENEIILYLNKDITLGIMNEVENPKETIFFKNNSAFIKLLRIPFDKNLLTNEELKILDSVIKLLNLKKEDITTIIKSYEYHDLVIVLNDVKKLRNLKPDFEKMAFYCKQIKDLRSISFTAKSNLKNIDYENRVFAPHINVNEDIVCVSINSLISDYWSRMLEKNDLIVLYPYHWNNNICGGIEFIKTYDNYMLVGENE